MFSCVLLFAPLIALIIPLIFAKHKYNTVARNYLPYYSKKKKNKRSKCQLVTLGLMCCIFTFIFWLLMYPLVQLWLIICVCEYIWNI